MFFFALIPDIKVFTWKVVSWEQEFFQKCFELSRVIWYPSGFMIDKVPRLLWYVLAFLCKHIHKKLDGRRIKLVFDVVQVYNIRLVDQFWRNRSILFAERWQVQAWSQKRSSYLVIGFLSLKIIYDMHPIIRIDWKLSSTEL